MNKNYQLAFSNDESETVRQPTGIGRVSEAFRLAGEYGIACIKRTGSLHDYGL